MAIVTLNGTEYVLQGETPRYWGKDAQRLMEALVAVVDTSTADVTLAAIGATANANGASLSGQVLTLQPASATYGGVLTAAAQSIKGAKTFSDAISASNLSGTNTGDATLGAIGSAPNANGALLTGQALVLQPADATYGGVLTAGTQSIKGSKTFVDSLKTSAGIVSTTNGGSNIGAANLGYDTIFVGNAKDNDSVIWLQGGGAGDTFLKGTENDGATAVNSKIRTKNAMTANGAKLLSVQNLTTEKLAVRLDGAVQFAGVATGSLADPTTCEGSIQYDSTTKTLKISNGTAWLTITAA